MNRVSRAGTSHHLRPKVMDVLMVLADNAGSVVSKDDILAAVWEKRFIAESALAGAVCELRDILGDDAQNPTFIETIPKRGYRLVARVTPLLDDADESPPGEPPTRRTPLAVRPRTVFALVLMPVALAILLVLASLSGPIGASWHDDGTIRIAVLPFTNLGPDADTFFATGVTEEITGRLGAVRDLVVTSSRSTLRYAGSGKSLAEIGTELNVGYLLHGSIRWDESASTRRVRITPRLVRVADGAVLWTEVYDRTIDDIFSVQADIARHVVERLNVTLLGRERELVESTRPVNIDAYTAYLQGRDYLSRPGREENLRLAATMLDRAVALDPSFATAFALLSQTHASLYHFGFDRTDERATLARSALDRATELDPAGAETILAKARYAYVVDRDYPAALTALDTLAGGTSGNADVHRLRGYVFRRLGRLEDALAELSASLDLSPQQPWTAAEAGATSTMLGRYLDADRWYERSIELAPDQQVAYEWQYWNQLLWTGDLTAARAILNRMPPIHSARLVSLQYAQAMLEGDYAAAVRWAAEAPRTGHVNQAGILPRSLLEGDALALAGETSRARAAYRDAVDILEKQRTEHPRDPRILAALGVARAALGRRAEAVEVGRRAVDLCPLTDDPIGCSSYTAQLARIHLLVGDVDRASALLRRVLSSPTTPEVRALLELDPRLRAARPPARRANPALQ